jgi:hypothetical protein
MLILKLTTTATAALADHLVPQLDAKPALTTTVTVVHLAHLSAAIPKLTIPHHHTSVTLKPTAEVVEVLSLLQDHQAYQVHLP